MSPGWGRLIFDEFSVVVSCLLALDNPGLFEHTTYCFRPVSYTHLDVYKRQVSDRQKLHTAALVEPAGERRKHRKARKHAAASIEAAARKADQAQERTRVAAERAERRNTTYLPAAGETGVAALRTPGRFRLPRHQDLSLIHI